MSNETSRQLPTLGNRPVGNVDSFRHLLEDRRDSIAAVLPKHLTAERMMKTALIAINRTPKLLECTTASVVESIMRAAELGLDCSGTLGRGYLIPYGDQCQFQAGYVGLVDLARRSGELSTIWAEPVYKDDIFCYELGLTPILRHVPNLDADRSNEAVLYFYCVITLKDGGQQVTVMTKQQVNEIRDRSKAWIAFKKWGRPKSGLVPWEDNYTEMGKKTVLRRNMKLCPMSVEVAQAFAYEDEAELDPKLEIKIPEPTSNLDPQKVPAVVKIEEINGVQSLEELLGIENWWLLNAAIYDEVQQKMIVSSLDKKRKELTPAVKTFNPTEDEDDPGKGLDEALTGTSGEGDITEKEREEWRVSEIKEALAGKAEEDDPVEKAFAETRRESLLMPTPKEFDQLFALGEQKGFNREGMNLLTRNDYERAMRERGCKKFVTTNMTKGERSEMALKLTAMKDEPEQGQQPPEPPAGIPPFEELKERFPLVKEVHLINWQAFEVHRLEANLNALHKGGWSSVYPTAPALAQVKDFLELLIKAKKAAE